MKGDEKKKDKRQSESKDATKDEKKPTSDGLCVIFYIKKIQNIYSIY